MTRRLDASKLRSEFADTLSRVAFGGERVIVRRNSKDVAALVSMQDYAFLEKLLREVEDRIDVAAALKALDAEGSVSLDEL